jgi:hypothetical protein
MGTQPFGWLARSGQYGDHADPEPQRLRVVPVRRQRGHGGFGGKPERFAAVLGEFGTLMVPYSG